MQRRSLLTLPLLAAPAVLGLSGLALAARPSVSEVRAGVSPARARRMQARLGIPVRAAPHGMVAALDAGHLEVALLNGVELNEARRLMGPRLLVLKGHMEGRTPVTRRVLPPALRTQLAASLA